MPSSEEKKNNVLTGQRADNTYQDTGQPAYHLASFPCGLLVYLTWTSYVSCCCCRKCRVQLISLLVSPSDPNMVRRPAYSLNLTFLTPYEGRFNPKAYSWFFVAGDLLSLAIQALGGSVGM